MLKKILLGLGAVLAVLAIVIAMQPDEYRYTRSTTVNAPAAAIYPQISNLRNWANWSPWDDLDPNARIEFSDNVEGEGATMHWAGNDQMGEGRMIITESQPSTLLRYDLEFVKPFPGTAKSDFVLSEENGQTKVEWSMYGKNNFIAKAMSLVFNCEKMIGEQFDKGLASLKAVAEKG